MMKPTKRPMQKVIIFRAYPRDVDLLHAAAEQKEISQSDFIRQALRKEAGRVLTGVDTGEIQAAFHSRPNSKTPSAPAEHPGARQRRESEKMLEVPKIEKPQAKLRLFRNKAGTMNNAEHFLP